MKRPVVTVLVGGAFALLFFSIRHAARPPAVPLRPAAVIVQPDTTIPHSPMEAGHTPAPMTRPPATPAPLVDQITRALRTGRANDRDLAFVVLLPALVASDPSAAGHLALAWEPGAVHDKLLEDVIRLWSTADIGGALTWLTSLLNNTDRSIAATAATALVAQSDAPGAIELSQLLHLGIDDGQLEYLAQLWTEENPRDAVDWIVTQPAGIFRDRLLARIAHVRAQSEPAEAARLVLDHMTDGDMQDEAIIAVLRQWAVRDPAAAEAWVGQFPPGPLHTRALAELQTARKQR